MTYCFSACSSGCEYFLFCALQTFFFFFLFLLLLLFGHNEVNPNFNYKHMLHRTLSELKLGVLYSSVAY